MENNVFYNKKTFWVIEVTLQQSDQKKTKKKMFPWIFIQWISQNFHVNLISNKNCLTSLPVSTVWTTLQIMNTFYHFVRDNHLLAIVETASVKGSVCLNLSNNDLKYVPDNIHTCNRLVKLFLHKNVITKVFCISHVYFPINFLHEIFLKICLIISHLMPLIHQNLNTLIILLPRQTHKQ